MTDLLPCPFCGSKPERGLDDCINGRMQDDPDYWIECTNWQCGVAPSVKEKYESGAGMDAMHSAWNTRTPPRITDAMVDAAVLSTLGRPYPSKQMMRAALTAALASTPVDTIRGGMG